MSDALLTLVVVLAAVLLAATVVIDWVAISSLFSSRATVRHGGCGHVRAVRTASNDRCWRCRHTRVDHALHAAEHPFER